MTVPKSDTVWRHRPDERRMSSNYTKCKNSMSLIYEFVLDLQSSIISNTWRIWETLFLYQDDNLYQKTKSHNDYCTYSHNNAVYRLLKKYDMRRGERSLWWKKYSFFRLHRFYVSGSIWFTFYWSSIEYIIYYVVWTRWWRPKKVEIMRMSILRRQHTVQNQPTDQNQQIYSWLSPNSNAHVPMKCR